MKPRVVLLLSGGIFLYHPRASSATPSGTVTAAAPVLLDGWVGVIM